MRSRRSRRSLRPRSRPPAARRARAEPRAARTRRRSPRRRAPRNLRGPSSMGKRLIIAAIVIALGAGVSYFRGNLILRAAQSLGFVDRPVAARNTLAKARELAKPTPAQEAASRLAEPEKAANAKTTPGSAAKPATQSAPARAAAPAAGAKPAAGATAAKATTPAKATAPAK